jgi:hypothetical protein
MSDGFLSQYLGGTVLRDADDPSKMVSVEGGALSVQGTEDMRPLITAGVHNNTPATLEDGEAGPLQLNTASQLITHLASMALPTPDVQPTRFRVMAAGSTNATSVKTSPGVICDWLLTNNTSADKFIKFYDMATAPTVGTDTPFLTLLLPQKTMVRGPIWSVAFTVGIAFAITGAVGDNDATAVTANDVTGALFYV